MSIEKPGTTRSVPLSRRWMADLMYLCRNRPLITFTRRMHLGEAKTARDALASRPSWSLMFLKAWALVAVEHPSLRTAWMTFPWNRIYTHGRSVGSLAIERDYEGEKAVFFVLMHGPETMPLIDLEARLRKHLSEPVWKSGTARRMIRVSRWPQWIRRLIWWQVDSMSGYDRARNLGTFGLSATASLGANALHLLSPLATALHYGTLERDGSIDVRITFDHRLLDGAEIARFMVELEREMNTTIAEELRRMG